MGEQWINKTRQKMDSYEEPAPQGLWDDIARAINQQPKPVPMYKRVMLWSTGVAAAAAAIIAVALFIGNDSGDELSPALSEQPQIAMQQEEMQENAPALKENISQEATTYLAGNTPTFTTKNGVAKSSLQRVSVKTAEEVKVQNLVEDTDREQTINKAESQPRKAVRNVQRQRGQRLLSTQQTAKREKKRHRFSAGLYAANLPHSSAHVNDYSEFVAGTTLPQQFSPQQGAEKTPMKDIIYSNLGKNVQTQKKHRLPVKFGLSFRYHFNDRWSLESGLTYTYLSADLKAGTDNHYFDSEQRLQYLGIPLNVNCNIWNTPRWNFYASAGGGMEKCIHGRLDTDYILNGKQVNSESRNIMEDPVQFSVNGAIGAQFNITRKIGIFAEPGVAYYFDNGSPVETIYKDKPFNFKFKMGLRLNFR